MTAAAAPLEGDFQQAIIDLAELCGWRVYHVANVRRRLRATTSVGFPDLVMVRDGRIIFAELKRGPRDHPTREQREWLAQLAPTGLPCDQDGEHYEGKHVIVCLWRPADWPAIEALLKTR